MDKLLQLLLEGESLTTAQMASILALTPAELDARMAGLRADGTLLGFRPVFNPTSIAGRTVRAVIEVRITPERDGGFNRIAERISRFSEVESCYLMSGAYDLLVIVRGDNLHNVASFVSEKLATIGGVLSTATHFMLRAYKIDGFSLASPQGSPDKPSVSP